MHKKLITTSNEDTYFALNQLVHYRELVVPKTDIEKTRSIKRVVKILKDFLIIEEKPEGYLITKTRPLNIALFLRRKWLIKMK